MKLRRMIQEMIREDHAFVEKSDTLNRVDGTSRLRKKGVSVKLPCRWSQEHNDVRP